MVFQPQPFTSYKLTWMYTFLKIHTYISIWSYISYLYKPTNRDRFSETFFHQEFKWGKGKKFSFARGVFLIFHFLSWNERWWHLWTSNEAVREMNIEIGKGMNGTLKNCRKKILLCSDVFLAISMLPSSCPWGSLKDHARSRRQKETLAMTYPTMFYVRI